MYVYSYIPSNTACDVVVRDFQVGDVVNTKYSSSGQDFMALITRIINGTRDLTRTLCSCLSVDVGFNFSELDSELDSLLSTYFTVCIDYLVLINLRLLGNEFRVIRTKGAIGMVKKSDTTLIDAR